MMSGSTYRYYNGDPLYPFGYGLSYTEFEYEAMKVTPSAIKVGEGVKAQVTVWNKGGYTADEVGTTKQEIHGP